MSQSPSTTFTARLRSINWTNLDCVEKRVSRFFGVYGAFVSRYPIPFILFPILVAGALSVGFVKQDEVTDATYLYTPTGAIAKYERECVNEKWPMVDGRYIPGRGVTELRQAVATVSTSDGGSILRPQHADAVIKLNSFVLFDIKVTYRNRTYNYMDLCLHWKDQCYTNPQVGLISTLFNYPDPAVANLTYPTAQIRDNPIYLASSLGGAEVDKNAKIRTITFAQAWLLLYQLQFNPDNVSYASGLWELEFQRRLLEYKDPSINVAVFHSQTLSLELKRNGDELVPRFAISFALLVTFATLVTYSFVGAHHGGGGGGGFPWIDWAVSKPLLAVFGAASGGMGIASAIGFLSICGFMFNQIVGVMPFLVLAIALDGTFIMISAYHHTGRSLAPAERVSRAMSESASAVMITMTTAFCSFLSGFTVDIPAVQVFSVYTAVAIAMTFFYLMTFWLGFLVLAARNEEKNQHAMFTCMRTVSPKAARTKGFFVRFFNQGTRPDSPSRSLPTTTTTSNGITSTTATNLKSDRVARWFRETYAPILMSTPVRIAVILLLCAYLGVFGWLFTQVHQGLDPIKLLVKGSYAVPYYRTMEQYFWRNGSEMQLVVNNAPNLADRDQRALVKRAVAAFATTEHSMGIDSVQFWLYRFESHMLEYGLKKYVERTVDVDDYYQAVFRFMSLSANEQLRQDLIWGYSKLPNTGGTTWTIPSFRLVLGLTGVETSVAQIRTVEIMRRLAAVEEYRSLNITTFNPVWLFVDQYTGILPNIIHEVVAGMCFIIVIALLLIPNPLISVWAALTILSVDVGVMGCMPLWDISLDTISMVTIMMSIGFSVDYAAYIAHAFVLSSDTRASPVDKVKSAMGEIAWPILQGATSTVLGVVVLADLDSYMVVAFFKTVFLVIIFALLHGLVFLPVLLSIFVCTSGNGCCGGSKTTKTRRPHQVHSTTTTGVVPPPMDAAALQAAQSAAPIKYPGSPLPITDGRYPDDGQFNPYNAIWHGTFDPSSIPAHRNVVIMSYSPTSPRVLHRRIDQSAVDQRSFNDPNI